MTFFNPNIPLLCRKQNVFELSDIPGIWRFHWQIGNVTLFSTFYTQLDQACLIWSVISTVIFATLQFVPISWTTQSVWWSIFTVVGVVGMIALTPSWLKEELGWILYSWVILMLLGLVISDLSIFLGWGQMLMYLCPLWLGLIALGYLCTGLGMRSRTLMLIGLVHLLSIAVLLYAGSWQFLATGLITGGSALLVAELQWDSYGSCGNQFWNLSEGQESAQGRWAKGSSMDGKGEFEYVANPQPQGPEPEPPQPNPLLHRTGKTL